MLHSIYYFRIYPFNGQAIILPYLKFYVSLSRPPFLAGYGTDSP